MKKRLLFSWILALSFFCLEAGNLTGKTSVYFADSLSAARFIITNDDYTSRLSAYDRSAGMNTDKNIDQKTYLDYCAQNVRTWSADEKKRFTSFIDTVSRLIAPYQLNLPDSILLLKTTSLEMGGVDVAYTRQNGIFFTEPMLNQKNSELRNTLIHEIFHVLSRKNAHLQNELYRLIGFDEINEIKLPQEWDVRRITNPDAPKLNTMIQLKLDSSTKSLTPFLFSSQAVYNTKTPGGIFQSINFMLLEIEEKNGRWAAVIKNDRPVLYAPGSIKNFWDKIGRNTQYILHPEEILASNFVLLITNRVNLPSPWLIEAMRKTLMPR